MFKWGHEYSYEVMWMFKSCECSNEVMWMFVCLTGRPCGTRLGPGGPDSSKNSSQAKKSLYKHAGYEISSNEVKFKWGHVNIHMRSCGYSYGIFIWDISYDLMNIQIRSYECSNEVMWIFKWDTHMRYLMNIQMASFEHTYDLFWTFTLSGIFIMTSYEYSNEVMWIFKWAHLNIHSNEVMCVLIICKNRENEWPASRAQPRYSPTQLSHFYRLHGIIR